MNIFWIKYSISIIASIIVGYVFNNLYIGIALLAAMMTILYMPIWVRYAKDNPEHYWFKRKLFGWGWTPVTWQGFLVTFLYGAAVAAFVLTLDESSPPNEVFWTFLFPVILLTILMIRIVRKTGEKLKWEWGKNINKYVK